jgi:hypothetical protein
VGRPRQGQDAAIDGSRNYGIYRTDSGEQVAYARVITDGATFAWLCDVFVDSSVRGLRIGIVLVETVCEALGGLLVTGTVRPTSEGLRIDSPEDLRPVGQTVLFDD